MVFLGARRLGDWGTGKTGGHRRLGRLGDTGDWEDWGTPETGLKLVALIIALNFPQLRTPNSSY
ncbi:hypothetical protein CWATWH0005_802 [Crocosphaera watsonii WH 0005]|uniref:Uncharacterized protein n=1 Tax=Crocosphaera watsonii WH 0005 TaxID=423472 RepID=T2ITN5_CROWT|nr:hypothetical protein CWATWH0005_802 [Crocosphaera watsonii WH 0005]